MGKRKSKQAAPKKQKRVVAKVFDCLFCHHSESVGCKINKQLLRGELKCRICGVSFDTKVESIHDPIDVYSEWIDQCEALEKEKSKEKAAQAAAQKDTPSVGSAVSAAIVEKSSVVDDGVLDSDSIA